MKKSKYTDEQIAFALKQAVPEDGRRRSSNALATYGRDRSCRMTSDAISK